MLPVTSNTLRFLSSCKSISTFVNTTRVFYCASCITATQSYIRLDDCSLRRHQIHQSYFSTNTLQCAGEKLKPATVLSTLIQNKEEKEPITQKDESKQNEGQTEDEESRKQKESAWRAMKFTFVAFGVSFTCLGGYIIYELGKPPMDSEGRPMFDEFSQMPAVKQYILRTLRELDYYKRMIKEPSREKLLPDPLQFPYYQPPYTLILELTDILVHPDWTYQTGWRFKKRPGLDHFLETVNGMFEVVIYTAEQGMTVFPLIEALDPKNIISYKLVRDATHFIDGHHVKSLDKLNRDLSKVIVVDWNIQSVKFNPDSVFLLPRWNGNDDDTTLIDLAAFLRTVAQSEIEDVRDVLKYYNQFDDPLSTFREKQKMLMEQQEAEKQKASSQEVPVVKRWAPSLLKRHL